MSFSPFSIERKVTAEHGDCLVFTPPLNTPELDAALELEYPHILSAKERKQKAVLDFFVTEQHRERMMKEREQIRLQKEQLNLQKQHLEQRSQQLDQALGFNLTPADLAIPMPTPSLPVSCETDLFITPDLPLFDLGDVPTAPHTGASPMFDILDTPADSLWLSESTIGQAVGSTTPQDLLLLSPIDLLAVSSLPLGPTDLVFDCPPSATTACLTTPSDTPRSVSAFDADGDLYSFLSDNPCLTPATGVASSSNLTNLSHDVLFSQPSAQTSPMCFNGSWHNTPVLESFQISSPQFVAQPSPLAKALPVPTVAESSNQANAPSEPAAQVPSMDNFTSVWSLFPDAQPKRRTRRRMTEAEKKEYRVKRRSGACDDCRRRRRKCHRADASVAGSSRRRGDLSYSCTDSPVSSEGGVNTCLERSGARFRRGAISLNQDIEAAGGVRGFADSTSSSSSSDNFRSLISDSGAGSHSRTISCPRGEPVAGFDGHSSSHSGSSVDSGRQKVTIARTAGVGTQGHAVTDVGQSLNWLDGGTIDVEHDNSFHSVNFLPFGFGRGDGSSYKCEDEWQRKRPRLGRFL